MPLKNKKNPPPSFHVLSGLTRELSAPLKSLLKSSQKLMDEYKNRHFEYIAYKDFQNIITTLDQMNRQLKRCCQTMDHMMRLTAQKQRLTPVPCQTNDVIYETIDLMQQNDVKRLPVVDEEGALIGIVTASDLFGILSEELSGLTKRTERPNWRKKGTNAQTAIV